MHLGIIIIICLLFSAFFSGMEIAFISANRLRIELDKKQGLFSSRIVSIFTNNPAQLIATLLVGNNAVLVIYGIKMAQILEPFLFKITVHEYYVLILQTIISTLFILITAEFLPKAVFRLSPNLFLNYLCIPVFVFYILLFPITQALMWISNWFLNWIVKGNLTPQNTMYVFGKIDLSHLVQNTRQQGKQTLDTEHEIRIFQNALDFSNVKLRECMVPRPEVVAVEDSCTVEELRNKFIETGYSKILIYSGNIDNIIGYVSSKDLFKNPLNLKSKIIKAPIVPETMNANKLLHILLQERKSLAVVVDEFGGTSGIVTTEDIMEEIFGEIEDEHDTDEIIEKVLSDSAYIFSGKLQIDYINKKYNLNISDSEEYETLAGFVFYHLGRIPSIGEQFNIEHFVFKILKVNNKRLELIYLSHLEE
jgi:CBS domain containing-hemolysin-like protein